MPAILAERRIRAERLRDYFALQLCFAEHVASRAAIPLAVAVARLTNLHRRFGLGDGGDAPQSRYWHDYACELERLRTADQRLAWTLACFVRAPQEALPAHERQFGCFSCAPPDEGGVVRIHFANRDSQDGAGPLSRLKMPNRMDELARMFAFIRATYSAVETVQGASWLYNLEAYCRLFPPAYAASRLQPARVRLSGSSSWGQFLDHRGAVKPGLRDAFLRAFEDLDVRAPWQAFPLPALRASAPIARFYAFYQGEAGHRFATATGSD
jgi:hypothetical protein